MFLWTFPARPRNPLVRVLLAIAGVIVVLAVLAFGIFAAAALFVGGAIVLLVNALRAPRESTARTAPPPSPPPGVIEGEFHVVHDARRDRQASR